jgi:hypothetical protein
MTYGVLPLVLTRPPDDVAVIVALADLGIRLRGL